MPLVQSDAEAALRQLEQVLLSNLFARSEQLSRLLRFLVERCLEGHLEELKESVIAIEVFGRRPDYNPRHDPIVRTEARRLRARLDEYYLSQGKSDPLVIELPKGGYVPQFRETGIASYSAPSDRGVLAGVKAARRPRWSKLWAACALAGLAAAAGTIAWWWLPRQSSPIPIAVLPLENLNHAAADDYFSDGLTDEIIRNLAIIDGLAVRSQTSSFAFKSRPRNLRDAAKQLQADYLLEGSVLRDGQRLRINVQLVPALDDSPIWTERYDRVITDVFAIFAIQDEISRAIVNHLRLKLGRGRRRYETSIEAYDLYLRARSLPLEHGFVGHQESVPLYEAAIAKDSSFAPAYAGLAIAHAFRSNEFQLDYAEARARMRTAAEKAIELDPLLGEAHEALAFAYDRDARWKEAEVSFRRALELEPRSSGTRSHFAISHLLPLGRVQEALSQLRIAEKNDPLSPEVHQILAAALLIARQYDEAAVHAGKMPDGSTLKLPWLARARFFQGRTAEAIQLFESAHAMGLLGYAYGRVGRVAEAERLASGLTWDPAAQALTFAGLGDRDRVLGALERAVDIGPVRLGRLLNYPEMALVRGDLRVKALRKRVGLPE